MGEAGQMELGTMCVYVNICMYLCVVCVLYISVVYGCICCMCVCCVYNFLLVLPTLSSLESQEEPR